MDDAKTSAGIEENVKLYDRPDSVRHARACARSRRRRRQKSRASACRVRARERSSARLGALYSRAMAAGVSVMDVLSAIYSEAISQGTPLFLLVLILTGALLRGRGDQDLRARRRVSALLFALHLLLLPI